jgi:hypothetical protein
VPTLIASEDAVVRTIQHVRSTVRSSSVGSGPGALIVKDGYVCKVSVIGKASASGRPALIL